MSETKPVRWVGDSLSVLRGFPAEVRADIGIAIYVAQRGAKHPSAKPLKGFGSASVLEIVEDFRGDAYRAVYTVRFAGVIYVLHAFQKKSKRAIATPKREITLVRERLRAAEAHYRETTER